MFPESPFVLAKREVLVEADFLDGEVDDNEAAEAVVKVESSIKDKEVVKAKPLGGGSGVVKLFCARVKEVKVVNVIFEVVLDGAEAGDCPVRRVDVG